MAAHSSIPKAVLYYDPQSVWSRAALLALREKGYGDDEIDMRVVDVSKGKELSPSFLRLSPKATVPTLVVPLQDSLAPDVEVRFKAIVDPKVLIGFLDKSRSANSHTHTTSSAPAPSLSPASIGFSSTSAKIIDAVHSDAVSPDTLQNLNARDPPSLEHLAQALIPTLDTRRATLVNHLADNQTATVPMSNKTTAIWNEKKEAIESLLRIFGANGGDQAANYFSLAKQAWEVAVPDVLSTVNKEMIGPYVLGDQLSIADIHLSVWLAHVVKLSGGSLDDSGDMAIGKVEQHINSGFALPKDFRPSTTSVSKDQPVFRSKLAAFWEAMAGRSSWKDVYGLGFT